MRNDIHRIDYTKRRKEERGSIQNISPAKIVDVEIEIVAGRVFSVSLCVYRALIFEVLMEPDDSPD